MSPSARPTASEPRLDAFWRSFAAENWEREPLSAPEAPLGLGVDDAELMLALRLAADADASANALSLPRLVVSVDGRTQPIDTRPFLPQPCDATLDEYLARVDESMREHDWSIAVSGLHAVSAVMWDRAKALSDEVFQHTGVRVAGRVDMDTFIGRYASTNVGVHVDDAGNFGFTLRGRKRLLTWPPEDAAAVPQHTGDYEVARASARELLGIPGALTYFPSRQLHVGESPDTVSVNVNIAFFTHGDPNALLTRTIGRLLAATHRHAGTDAQPHVGPGSMPTGSANALAALASIPEDTLADEVWVESTRAVTSSGLGTGRPATAPLAGLRGRALRLRPGVVLHHRKLADGRRAVATQGHTLRLRDHEKISGVLDALADAAVLHTTSLTPAWNADELIGLYALLTRLSTWDALEPVGEADLGPDQAAR